VPSSFNQILLLLVFIVPGFVLMRVKRLAYPSLESTTATAVLDSLALSCVVYGLVSPLLYFSFLGQWYKTRPGLFAFVAFFVLLIAPTLLGAVYVWLTKTGRAAWLRGFLGFPHPDPTAWDYHFRKEKAYWVWLTFKSGKVMAGLFGPNSFASSFPHKRDLYIEKLLRLDEHGRVVEWIENSAGALVMMEDLERIQFFEIEEVSL
jgi:Family of unknown function (DUF6338)